MLVPETRILHFNDRLSARGGADWFMHGAIAGFAGGFEVELAVGRDDGTCRGAAPVTVLPGLESGSGLPTGLDALCQRFRPDLVHLHNVVNPDVLRWAGSLPAVMTVHDHRCFCPGRGKVTAAGLICISPMSARQCAGCFDDVKYFRRILATTTERLEALRGLTLHVLSNYMRNELIAVGVPATSVHVVPPWVYALDPCVPDARPRCILFAGRLVEAKGIFHAVAAWEQSELDLPLVFAGTGSGRNELERRGFEVLGWQDRSILAGLYESAAALIFPPHWQEPFGIAGLEALAMQTPVVAWRSGGIPEWHPDGGLLVDYGDIPELARALRLAVAGPPVLSRPAQSGAECIGGLKDIYRQVMSV